MKEAKTLEFKQEISRTFLKTVSAYANFESGEILFGVADDGAVVGIDDPASACLTIENYVNDNIKPMPRYTLEVRTLQDRQIVALRVFEGKDKPYYYHGKAYRRSDTSDVEVDRLELNRLVLEGQNLSFEEVKANSQDLTFSVLSDELERQAGVAPLDLNVLKTLRLYSDGEGYNNAAAVLADENNFAGTDIVRFGKDENVILDRERWEGVSALHQLEASLEMFRTYYQYEKIEGVRREEKWLVPEEAFREAVANALVHRQWDSPASIQISFNSDCVRVTSPGGLPTGISLDEYLNGRVSVLRNPIIGNVFYRLNYVEIFGTGVLRIKRAYATAAVNPQFDVSDNYLTVVLPVLKERPRLSAEEEAVLQVFEGGRLLSRKEVEQVAGLSRDKTVRLLGMLVDKGYLQKEGNGRATRYGRARGM